MANQEKSRRLLNSDRNNNEIFSSKKSKSLFSIGQIKEVHLVNFMCHQNFVIQFHPTHMQIVTGENGSGKSAIANAICLCLGAQARTTGRTSNVQSFIRKGETFAELTVVLANEGVEAYKPEIYGNEIRIIRKIGLRQSGYRISSIHQRCRSISKETIDEILQALSILPENPLCILHQEIAKTFLLNNDSRRKYQFYIKVSQLDQIKQAYEQGLCTVQLLRQRVEMMKTKYQQMIKDLEALEQEVRKIEVRRDYEERKHGLEGELRTARTDRARQELFEVQDEYEQIKLNRENLEREILDEKTQLREIEQRIETHFTDKLDFERDINDLEKLSTYFSKQKHALQTQISTYSHRYETSREQLTEIEPEQLHIQKQIEKYEQINTQTTQFDQDYLLIDHEISTRKDQENQYEQELIALHNERIVLEDEIRENHGILKILEHEFEQKQADINQLKQVDAEKINIHAAWMSDCLKTIENEQRFHQTPIGPLSRYIHCLSSHWSYAVEKHLAPILSAFICSNASDVKLLHELLSIYSSDFHPPIYTRTYSAHIHDISGTIHCTQQANLLTINDVIKIDHPTVACVLIDYKQIEATILVENFSAVRALKEDGRLTWKKIDRKVKQVVEAWTEDGSNIKLDSTFRVYANDRQPRRYFLTSHMRTLNQEQLKEDAECLEKQIEETRAKGNDLDRNREKVQQEINQMKKNNLQNRKKINQLLKEHDRFNTNMPVILDCSLEELKEKSETLTQTHLETVQQYTQSKDQHEKASKELTEINQDYGKILFKIDSKTKEYDLLIEILTNEQSQCSNAHEKLPKLTRKIQQLDPVIKQYEEKIQKLNKQISKKSKKSHVDIRSIRDIQQELHAINHYLEINQDTNEIRRNLIETYRFKRDQTREYKQLYERCLHQVDYLQAFILRRQEGFLTIADQHQYLLRWKFQNLMKNYSFEDCDIEIDHKKEELHIIVNRDERNIHLLSGGEKSLSIFCFLLALWQSIYQPFRLLDEIDIYMDNENLSSVFNLLYENTRQFSSSQHVILTPQAVDQQFWNQLDVPVFQMPRLKRSFE